MVRFAPSPTGDMHIGNLRVAVINHLLGRQRSEPFLVRIEDTDTERNIEGKDREILELLRFFGLDSDQQVYQSENLRFHREFAERLLKEGKAFRCECSEEALEAKREAAKMQGIPYRYDGACADKNITDAETVVRLAKPESAVSFTDHIKGELRFEPDDIDSFVILRKDATPTYNFACAVDDMLYDISIVVRGEDHVSNTPKQIHIRNALGYDKAIEYAHLPIILNETGKKMSKRDEASSVQWLLEEGFLPQAILNYLLLIGSGSAAPEERFTPEEAQQWFAIDKLSKAPAKFDLDKLRFLNREHLKQLDEEQLALFIGYKGADFGKLAKIYLEEASTLMELKSKIDAVFSIKPKEGEFAEPVEQVLAVWESCAASDFETFKACIAEKTGLKGKKLFKSLRILLTGAEHGPELSDVYALIYDKLKEVIR